MSIQASDQHFKYISGNHRFGPFIASISVSPPHLARNASFRYELIGPCFLPSIISPALSWVLIELIITNSLSSSDYINACFLFVILNFRFHQSSHPPSPWASLASFTWVCVTGLGLRVYKIRIYREYLEGRTTVGSAVDPRGKLDVYHTSISIFLIFLLGRETEWLCHYKTPNKFSELGRHAMQRMELRSRYNRRATTPTKDTSSITL